MKKIKLNNLSARKMSEKQMDVVNGGYDTCQCSCYYENEPGGSSTLNNAIANSSSGYHSIKGEPVINMPKPEKSY